MRTLRVGYLAFAVVMVASVAASTQSQTQTQTRPSQTTTATQTAQELYHVHFVKAAPGKLRELIDSYMSEPQDPDTPDRPLVLRHMQGDDWDLVVLQPLGKQTTLRATPPTAEEMAIMTRNRPLRASHTDTFTLGPPWSETRTALLSDVGSRATGTPTGTAGSAPSGEIYTVTVYRALPGHRDQLWQVLNRISGLTPGRTITMQHFEGAAWDFVQVSRYDSWAALGESESAPPMERLRAQGFSAAEGPSLELREHLAEHRDTVAMRVAGASKPVR